MKSHKNKLIAALKKLGTTPTKVASSLKKMHITGIKESLCSCPIANYLKKQEFLGVFVDSDAIGIKKDKFDSLHIWIEISTAVANFIEMFDEGQISRIENEEKC